MLNDELLGSGSRKPRAPLLLWAALLVAGVLAAVFIGLYVHEAHKSAPAAAPSAQVAELQAELQAAQVQARTAQAALANSSSELVATTQQLNDTQHALLSSAAQLADSQAQVADLQKHGVPPPSPTTLSADMRQWILSAMDPSADPCEDFTQYTCGAWQAANPVVTPEYGDPTNIMRAFGNITAMLSQAEQDVLASKFEEAAQYHAGCMQSKITDASDERWAASLAALARWLAVIDEHFDVQTPDLSSIWYLLGLLNGAQMGQGALRLRFYKHTRYYPDGDEPPANTPAARLYELIPSFDATYSIPSQVFGGTYVTRNRDALPGALQLAQDALHNASLPTIFDPAVYSTAASAISALTDHYNDFQLQASRSQIVFTITNFTTLQDTGVMDSAAFLRGLGNHSWAYTFAGLDEGGVDHTGYADHLQTLLTQDTFFYWLAANLSTSVAQCNAHPRNESACHWLGVAKMSLKAEVLGAHWAVLPDAFGMGVEYAGLPFILDDWDRAFECGDAVHGDLENVFEHEEYINALGPGTTDVVTTLVERMWQELGSTLLANEWLDQATRTRAMNKWQLMQKNVAYESSWDNDQYGLAVTGSWYLDMVAGHSYATQRMLSTLDMPVDVRSPSAITYGMMNAFTVNAFYDPQLNSINMLPGMMFSPVFDATRLPFALNVASYGWVIGHEMTHGFDNNGRQYDALGQQADWWSREAASAFDERAQCFVDQYSSYKVLNQSINGAKTLGENIADNGGLGLAQRVYTQLTAKAEQFLSGTSISNEQLFFIWASQVWCQTDNAKTMADAIAGDVHSPGEVRAFAPMRNQAAFAQAFNCPARTLMGNTSRCNVW